MFVLTYNDVFGFGRDVNEILILFVVFMALYGVVGIINERLKARKDNGEE